MAQCQYILDKSSLHFYEERRFFLYEKKKHSLFDSPCRSLSDFAFASPGRKEKFSLRFFPGSLSGFVSKRYSKRGIWLGSRRGRVGFLRSERIYSLMIPFSYWQEPLTEGILFFLSVLLHEGGHLLAMALMGSGLRGMRLSLTGISLYADTDWLPYRKEALLHLAGPLAGGAASIVTLLLIRQQMTPYRLYFFFTNALLTLLNLMPVMGLDGYGVMLSLFSLSCTREEAVRRCLAIHWIALFLLLGIAFLFLKEFQNPSLLLLCTMLLAEQKRKKATNES